MSYNKTISDNDTNNHNNYNHNHYNDIVLPQNLLYQFHVKEMGINIVQIFITQMCVDNHVSRKKQKCSRERVLQKEFYK